MYLDAAVMDTEEALRTLELIGTRAGQFDTHMHVKGQKQGEIKGESLRPHGDGKPYHAFLATTLLRALRLTTQAGRLWGEGATPPCASCAAVIPQVLRSCRPSPKTKVWTLN